MKTIKLSNGVTINVSETEYKSYIAQTKALKDLEKNSNKLDAKTPTKSVSATYSDYVLRALKKGMELLYFSDNLSVVAKGDVVIAENRGFNKKMYYAIKKAITEHGGKWCGDHDKKVFTYKFNRKDGEKFIADQKARVQK
jgi:ribosome-associated translation inhibitor RaiA